MRNIIRLQEKEIPYTLRISRHARYMRLSLHSDGTVVMTAPHGISQHIIERFMISKSSWILKKLASIQSLDRSPAPEKIKRQDYLRHKSTAQLLAEDRVRYFNTAYKLFYRRITIRNQKTRWGSCSSKGNLNFNYKIMLLPPELSDYIIVHELCHLAELNHSKNFWHLVEKTFPHHAELRKELRKNGLRYLA